MPIQCASCGVENPDGNAFCQKCGAHLGPAPATPAPATPAPAAPVPAPVPTAAPPAVAPGYAVPPPGYPMYQQAAVAGMPVQRTSSSRVIAIVGGLIGGIIVLFLAVTLVRGQSAPVAQPLPAIGGGGQQSPAPPASPAAQPGTSSAPAPAKPSAPAVAPVQPKPSAPAIAPSPAPATPSAPAGGLFSAPAQPKPSAAPVLSAPSTAPAQPKPSASGAQPGAAGQGTRVSNSVVSIAAPQGWKVEKDDSSITLAHPTLAGVLTVESVKLSKPQTLQQIVQSDVNSLQQKYPDAGLCIDPGDATIGGVKGVLLGVCFTFTPQGGQAIPAGQVLFYAMNNAKTVLYFSNAFMAAADAKAFGAAADPVLATVQWLLP